MTVLVGINRYIAVCMPYQAIRMCTVQQAKRQLVVVLLFSLLYNAPRFAEGRLEYKTTPTWVSCAVHTNFAQASWYRIAYSNVMYTIFICVLPLLILTALNVRLMTALNDLKRKRREMQSARQQQDNNITLVLIVVIMVFSICQFPALLTQIFWTVLSDEARICGGFQFYFSRISNLLVTANSALNFFVYFSFNQRFRFVLAHMLGINTHPLTSTNNCAGAGVSRKTLTCEPPLLAVLKDTVGGDQLPLGASRPEIAGGTTTTTICAA